MKFLLALFLVKNASAIQDYHDSLSRNRRSFAAVQIVESLPENGHVRSLQSVCSQLEDGAESILSSSYLNTFNCYCSMGMDSSSYNTYRISCDTPEKICCGNTCGTVQWSANYKSNYLPEWEQTCLSHTNGSPNNLSGKDICHKSYYSGQIVTSCSSNVSQMLL